MRALAVAVMVWFVAVVLLDLAALGAASLAFLRFTRGPAGAGVALAGSIALWIVVPAAIAARRLDRVDI